MQNTPSTDEPADGSVIALCSEILQTTLSDSQRVTHLNALGDLSTSVERFVRGYERIDDPALDTDDEILNWTFAETATDLTSAIWLLASGFYKASASSLRNALDIAVAALYFQVRENAHGGAGWNKFYTEWDRGDRQTPNWGEMKDVLAAHKSLIAFKVATGKDPLNEAYSLFKHLCGYTHTSAYDSRGYPVTAINFTGTAPAFDVDAFNRGCDLARETMSNIVILWQVTFPGIARTDPLGADRETYLPALFPPPLGPLVLEHNYP